MNPADPIWPAPPSPDPPRKRRLPRAVRTSLLILVILPFALLGFRALAFDSFVVTGRSMEPTFFAGERILVETIAFRVRDLERGDIVVYEHPDEPGRRLIQRVVAFPGEVVETGDGVLYVNGQAVPEPYVDVNGNARGHCGPHEVPPGKYFMLGDQRALALDSRRIGFIPADRIVGRLVLRYYPPSRVRWF